eukprot:3232174-Amphidinium_carterae.1
MSFSFVSQWYSTRLGQVVPRSSCWVLPRAHGRSGLALVREEDLANVLKSDSEKKNETRKSCPTKCE